MLGALVLVSSVHQIGGFAHQRPSYRWHHIAREAVDLRLNKTERSGRLGSFSL